MTAPLVSVVLPTFNRLQFLPATVESVFAQTLREWELIVADDGSDQDVLDYLGGLCDDPRVHVLRLPHSGNPGIPCNAAIAAARAPLLAFLDSDDLWEPNKLERQLAAMRSEPECGWSYTAFIIIDAAGEPLASERDRPWTPHSGSIFAQTVRTTASIRTPAVIARTELVRQIGAFDEAIDCGVDYDLWMRLALRSRACVVDEPLVRVRRHDQHLPREVGASHLSRDYSLRKLAMQVNGAERALIEEERSRNALAQARAMAARGQRWRALAPIGKSLPFSWRYAHWWYGAAKAITRACLPIPR